MPEPAWLEHAPGCGPACEMWAVLGCGECRPLWGPVQRAGHSAAPHRPGMCIHATCALTQPGASLCVHWLRQGTAEGGRGSSPAHPARVGDTMHGPAADAACRAGGGPACAGRAGAAHERRRPARAAGRSRLQPQWRRHRRQHACTRSLAGPCAAAAAERRPGASRAARTSRAAGWPCSAARAPACALAGPVPRLARAHDLGWAAVNPSSQLWHAALPRNLAAEARTFECKRMLECKRYQDQAVQCLLRSHAWASRTAAQLLARAAACAHACRCCICCAVSAASLRRGYCLGRQGQTMVHLGSSKAESRVQGWQHCAAQSISAQV